MTVAITGARESVAAASRRLAEKGLLVGTAGNVSALVDGRADLVAITATGADLATIATEQVTVVERSGRVVAGDLAPTSELDLHLGVYERYGAAGAASLVHTHSPLATALSCVLDELPCIHYQQLLLGGTIRVAPYATFGTPDLAASVLDALDGRSAALMANHGAVAFGADLGKAVENALLLEWLCSVYHHAAAVGTPQALDDEQQAAVVTAAVQRQYGSTRPHTPSPQEEQP